MNSLLDTVIDEFATFGRSWNLSAPVYRLPPELLTSCFRFLDLRALLQVSSVSHRWRKDALCDPALWASCLHSFDGDDVGSSARVPSYTRRREAKGVGA